MVIWKVVLTGWVKNIVCSVLKDEGKNDLLANGENRIQGYCCVLGWAGNLNIHRMVILLGPSMWIYGYHSKSSSERLHKRFSFLPWDTSESWVPQ